MAGNWATDHQNFVKGMKNKKSMPRGPKKDPFFSNDSKKRRKYAYEDDEVESDDEDVQIPSTFEAGEEEEEEEVENADERKRRLALKHLESLREIARKTEELDEEDGDKAADPIVARILQQEQLEGSGRARKLIASRVQKLESVDGFQLLVKHRQSVTAVVLSEDDLQGFSSSKDGVIVQWDVEGGKRLKYEWPSDEVLKSHGMRDPQSRTGKHSRQVLALAVSSDGRHLASAGLDRHVHLWDARTREHLHAFPGHKAPVSCLTFREGSADLYSGSFDRKINRWNTEDRVSVESLFGPEAEVLAIDSLRKERVLAVGRDRYMRLFKVPEETQLKFNASNWSFESCCMVNDEEFLTGSDDGSIQLWSHKRKKPVFIVRNAHIPLSVNEKPIDQVPNGHTENGYNDHANPTCSSAYSWVSSVALCGGSDLAASGAGNGCVRLWAIENSELRPIFDMPLVGFVNSLAFARSGRFLLAGVGQEPRLGRWGRISGAQNGVAIHPFALS